MRGYELIQALNTEADDTATQSRAELMRDAAREIEALIKENRSMQDSIEKLASCTTRGERVDLAAHILDPHH